MTPPKNEYRKLPGIGLVLIGLSRLHAARDHLLLATSVGFVQSYKRFYFRDIQAIIIRKSITGKVWNWVLASLTTLAALLGYAGLSAPSAITSSHVVLWSIDTVIFASLLLINTLRGPTCTCHIRTAVQTERLAPLTRLRTACKVLQRIKPLITEAQGTLAPEGIPQRMRDIASGRVLYDPLLPPVIGSSPGSPIIST